MLPIEPKKTNFFKYFKTGAKYLIAAEILGFVVSYGVWNRMNHNREFRLYLNESFPSVLEGYYKFGELIDKDNVERIRNVDQSYWALQKSQPGQQE